MRIPRFKFISLVCLLCGFASAQAQVIINEIHYRPVEEPAFDSGGNPIVDLTDDVHEFIELRNVGASAVSIAGWQIDDGVAFTVPAGQSIAAGGYKVIAKNPARLQTVYGISGVLGPYTGVLSNGGETIKLKNAGGTVVDAVSYSTSFPWAVSADGLGAGAAFQGTSSYPYQYKGRSLQRVSATALSNDPANWLASPLSPGPTPGSANAVTRAVPKPVVVSFSVAQASDESQTIRATEAVKVDVYFSGTTALSAVEIQWFVDDIESTAETRAAIAMTDLGNGHWVTSTSIPGQVNRSVVRWRVRANRGDGLETVSPRADDPQIAPIGAGGAREAWHGYFVEPVRSSSKPIYDFFISAANVAQLDTNINQSPRRVTPGGYPRDDPKDGYYPPNANYNPAVNYPAAGQPKWDGVVPAVFVRSGVVYDIVARYHGSRYQRAANKNSWKFTFPSSKLMDGKQRILVTEKTGGTVLGLALYREAGLPAGYSQFVDFFKNTDAVGTQRCEITDADEETVAQYQREQQEANPQNPPSYDGLGIIYKSKGLDGNEGPYGWANGQPMPAAGAWSILDRYIHSFPSQLNDWRGHLPFKAMIDGTWAARGDAALASYPNIYNGGSYNPVTQVNVPANITNLRAYLATHWDVDKMLSYLAIRNWCSPWDDKFHNHYVYLQPDGKWTMVPWDFDGEMSGGATGDAGYTNSIFAGRKDDLAGTYSNNSRGPNWFKDHVLRAYETEYKQRLFTLNNTLLSPASVTAIAAAYGTSVPDTNWLNQRLVSVNTQCGLGTWFAPSQPVNNSPGNGGSVIPPASLTASAYTHTSGNTTGGNAHASTRWEIRASSGTYRAPIYKVTSATNLTSLPVPFDLLEFGRSYAWRATYLDASGHPSATSAETTFYFGPQPAAQTLIAWNDSWKYNRTDDFNDSTWAQTAYNDATAAWLTGAAAMAFEPNGIAPPAVITTALPDPRTAQGRNTIYFRRHFNFPGDPSTATVRIRHLVDDGCVIYINGNRVHRYGLPDLAAYPYAQLAGGMPTEAVYQLASAPTNTSNWATIDPRPFLVQGDNVIAVEVHQNTFTAPGNSGNSSDVVFAVQLEADIITLGGSVALNEIMSDNRNAVANGASTPDYIELRNNTAAPINLTGWSLSDDVLVPAKYNFPAGISIPAGGYLTVWCDSNVTDPGLHAGFGLNRDGQTVALFQGTSVRDFVTYGPQAPNLSIGRVSDGVGAWTLVTPSVNATNSARTLGSGTTLKINEWMASPVSGEDWFEIYNPDANAVALGGLWLSDTPGNPITQIPALSFIAGRGFTRFDADGTDGGANHVNFKLGAGGDNLLLLASNGSSVIDSINFGAQAAGASQGRLPDGTATFTPFTQTPSPAESNWLPATVVVNEALANSTAPFEDAIELRNTTGGSVNIGGWWLSDDRSNLQKFQIPAGTTLAGGAFKVFYENQFNAGANPFSLSSLGDELILSAVDGLGALTGLRSQVSFGASAENVSFGRVLTGNPAGSWIPEFWPQVAHTFGQDSPASVAEFRTGTGATNGAPVVGPIVINEVMYHPPDLAGGADNVLAEFIELHNITTTAIDISGCRIKADSEFTFPPGSTIRPGDYILVVSFNPLDTATLANFRAQYSLSAATPIFGPYSPKLGNGTHNIEFAYPGPIVGAVTPLILIDKIKYTDTAPWPTTPDGTGPSLQRANRTVIGNDPANWTGASATAGTVNSGQAAITDNDGDGMPNAWEDANGLDKFSAADALSDEDSDGHNNLAEYLAGTDPSNSASYFKTSVTTIAGGYRITFTAQAGHAYTIQYRDSLTAGDWLELTDIAAPGTTQTITRDDLTAVARRFYRVVTPQP